MSAAGRRRHGLRLGATFNEAVAILQREHEDVDLFVVDLDEKIHGVSLVSMLDVLLQSTPVILVTEFEPNYCASLCAAHGARLCFGKPVSTDEFARAFERFAPSENPVTTDGEPAKTTSAAVIPGN